MRRNSVRIIAGTWRRRLIHFPDAPDLRPTPDRVRETLFNWLGQDLTGKSCLDLFAGSGALGFEAASRAARRVLMVEREPMVLRALQESAKALGIETVEFLRDDALQFLRRPRGRFDVVFLDPPYRSELLPQLLPLLPAHLNDNALVYAEHRGRLVLPENWHAIRRSRAGQVNYLLIQYMQDEQSPNNSGLPGNF
jgi:16S rRNA (guanine(966)-N(2))-methyltransferase RsmD